jgi:uncharacterized protein (DUF1501 family)
LKRREFLASLAMTGGLLIPVGHQAWAISNGAGGNERTPGRPRRLVVIMLRGAVDGLSVVAPYGDPDYARQRPTIAVGLPGTEDGLTDLDGFFGLHPALSPLLPLWLEKKLAFVHASGSPDPTRSHFDAQDYLESGTPGRKLTSDGWLNRLATVMPGKAGPTRAVSMGPVLPRILAGEASAYNLPYGAVQGKPELIDRPGVASAFDQLYRGDDKLGRTYVEGRQARKEVMDATMDKEMAAADNGAPPASGFPEQAARLANLMNNAPNIQFAFIGLGGWDTHANQGAGRGQLANRLTPLGQGLAEFARRLGPTLDDTVIAVMSEFGRTVRENGNRGTDHGHGNVIWLLGGKVIGGKVYGEWPGLNAEKLHEGRDLAVTSDFRTVLAHVAQTHLQLQGAAVSKVFPGEFPSWQHPSFMAG